VHEGPAKWADRRYRGYAEPQRYPLGQKSSRTLDLMSSQFIAASFDFIFISL
jgi:hypothetical protein